MLTEARIQQDAFATIRNNHPETYGCIWHVPNGALRDEVTAMFLRGQGVVPGVQDLHFVWAGKYYIIEVKTPTGYCSADQKVIHATHKLQGFDTYIFTNSDDIIAFVEDVLSGRSMGNWELFISPFARPEMLNIYKEELRIERKNKAEAKKRKMKRAA